MDETLRFRMEAEALFQKAFAEFDAAAEKASKAVELLGRKSEGTGKQTSFLDGQIGRLSASFAAGFTASALIDKAIGKLTAYATSTIAAADQAVFLSNKTGLTTETIQRMATVAQRTSVDMGALTMAAFNLSNKLANDTKSAKNAANELGLSWAHLKTLGPDELFFTVTRALEGIESPQERNRLAIQLYGNVAKNVLPAVEEGLTGIADAAIVSADAQIRAVKDASDAWNNFIADVGKKFEHAMGTIVVQMGHGLAAFKAGTDAYREADSWLGGVTAGVKAHFDTFFHGAKQAEGAAKDHTGAMRGGKDASVDYTAQLQAAKNELVGLDAATRAEIAAADKLGATTDDITEKFGLTAGAQKLLKEGTTLKAREDEKAEAALKKHRDELTRAAEEAQKFKDALFGEDTITKAAQYVTAIGNVENATKLSKEKQVEVNKVLGEAIATYARLGRTAPPEILALDAATRQVLVSTRQWAAVELPAAVAQVTPFAATVRNLGVESVPQLSASINSSRLGFVGFKSTVEDSREEIARIREEMGKAGTKAREFGASLSTAIIGAFQGGGNVGKTIGGFLGKEIGTTLGNKAGEWAGKAIGGTLGSAVGGALGTVVPVVGTILGGLLGSAVGKLFSGVSPEVKKARAEVDQFQASLEKTLTTTQRNEAGNEKWKMTLIAVRDAYLATGRSAGEAEAIVKQLWNTDKPDQARKAMEEINRVMGEQKQKFDASKAAARSTFDELIKAAAEAGTEVPESMQNIIDKLVETGLLTDDDRRKFAELSGSATVNIKEMERAAKELGIELTDLGPSYQQAKLNEEFANTYKNIMILRQGGVDAGTAINGARDEVALLVEKSLEFGTTIPANMKPFIEELIKGDGLILSNGRRLTDLSELNFAEPVVDRMVTIAEKLTAILEKLTGVNTKIGPELSREAAAGAGTIIREFDEARRHVKMLGDEIDGVIQETSPTGLQGMSRYAKIAKGDIRDLAQEGEHVMSVFAKRTAEAVHLMAALSGVSGGSVTNGDHIATTSIVNGGSMAIGAVNVNVSGAATDLSRPGSARELALEVKKELEAVYRQRIAIGTAA